MFRVRDILNVLRVVASWLLVVLVFFGPAGLISPAAFAASSGDCGPFCPCDEARDPHVDEHADDADREPRAEGVDAASDRHSDDPCEDQCPDDCPNCGCGLGVAMVLPPFPELSRPVTSTSAPMFASVDAPRSRTCFGVFRPPRSRTDPPNAPV